MTSYLTSQIILRTRGRSQALIHIDPSPGATKASPPHYKSNFPDSRLLLFFLLFFHKVDHSVDRNLYSSQPTKPVDIELNKLRRTNNDTFKNWMLSRCFFKHRLLEQLQSRGVMISSKTYLDSSNLRLSLNHQLGFC
jgi:hypothetical protein